jgi:hypothetical protein
VQGAIVQILTAVPDDGLARRIDRIPLQVHLYAALRREQRAVVASIRATGSEAGLILAFARSAFAELEALLAGREVLDTARDGEWSLRDLLRHAIAVELRYREQVLWSAERRDADPVVIPADRLPCDRLAPPVPEYAGALTGDTETVLELLARARARTDERLADLAATALDRPSLWGSLQVDVRERLHQIGVHLVEVIVQTEKMLGERESEARRIVRRIAAVRGLHVGSSTPAVVDSLDAQLAQLGRAVASG